MRIHPIPLIILLCATSFNSFSQKDTSGAINLRSGKIYPEKNISEDFINRFTQRLQKINGKSFAVVQFEQIPGDPAKKILASNGIELMNYIPNRAYTVSISKPVTADVLRSSGIISIFELTANQKMHPLMAKGILPSWAIKTPGLIDIWIRYPRTFSFEEIKQVMRENNIEISSDEYSKYHVLGLRILRNRLIEVASIPFIEYVEPAPHGDQPLNYIAKQNSRGNVLSAATGIGGYDLKGEGVTVGVGDDSDPTYHVDFTGRLIDFGPANYAYHGTHVCGTVSGGGIVNEQYAGYAPKSTLVSQSFSGILSNAQTYVIDHKMVVTNNSYGDVVGDCEYMGYYDLASYILDQMAFDLPNLQNVFAAGNDGGLVCSPYPAAFGTVLSGYQSAKNVLTIGATNRVGAVTGFSARGPVKDGRIKPELMADGFFTISTVPDDIYGPQQGTSMAAPAVTGGLALLYEKYRLQNGGADPKNGLIKALICNGGSDLGNNGPDYTNGFGWMNLLRSVDMLSNNHYFISNINNGVNNSHSISVPANTAQLKVTLYWNDPPAAIFSSQALVNDLDLEITTPGPSTILPFVLDTIPANVNNTASQAADHINNIEQVVIDNPASGTYFINVNGTTIPVGPQEYYVVYDIIPTETKIVYPIGNEKINPGETETIQWESYGNPTNTFQVEYSIDNGANWTIINSTLSASLRRLDWIVPSFQTDQAMVRVTRNGTGYSSTSSAFTIIGVPVASLAPIQCEGYVSFNWTPVTGATDYEVFQLQGTDMVAVGTTNSTSYTIGGLPVDKETWVSVCARFNGQRGRRADAIKRVPNSGTCSGSISDNDIKMDSIIAPVYGRLNTSTALSATTTISARIKNLDDADITNFKMRYYVGGFLIVEDLVSTTITPGSTYTHNFSLPYDFSSVNNYILRVEVENIAGVDPISENNFVIDTIRQLANDPIVLPFFDDIEGATSRQYYQSRFGIAGIERYDFTNTDPLGRLSTFLASGMAYSGSRSLIMDLNGWNGGVGSENFIYGTYNLNGIDAVTRDIRLDCQFKSHGDSVISPINKIWIRGDDTKPWIEAFTLSSNGNQPGVFKKTPSIELSALLNANSQIFSSSFQVRFGQFGVVHIIDNSNFQGHNFDDIRIYEAFDDIEMKSIDQPINNSCGLTNSSIVKVTVRNASLNPISNIPVRMVIDGGTPVIENIPGPIAPSGTVQYTFAGAADFSTFGYHTISVNVQLASDNYRENDTTTFTVFNAPLITTFPHLENFETGDGYWRSEGINSSWEYGTPASNKISRAASGIKAWKTSLTGHYNSYEQSYLYSPCYDITGMTNPTLSMNIALDLEDCGTGTLCDGAFIEYSTDGVSWNLLGDVGSGTNWYNRNYSGAKMWSVQDYTRWHVATTSLPTGVGVIRFRVAVISDPFVNLDGIAIDDVHVYDNVYGIYDGVTMGSPVSQSISGGTNWVDFLAGGKLIASIQPNLQNLGNTDVQTYINTSGVRNDGNQYYHDRNITIKPATTTLSDSVTIRFYFLDTETEALINASGCPVCTKPSMVSELGVTKYADADDNFENGDLGDDIGGTFSFISADWNYKIPFDKGYYIEYKVKDFSEHWLNNGGIDKQSPLPVELVSFSARKKNEKDVIVEWKTSSEQNVDHFEVEVAKGNSDYSNGRFVKLSEVSAIGNTATTATYDYLDTETNKKGIRYYRLKTIDLDNTFKFSPVRPVIFNNELKWQVYPNPSKGLFTLVVQLNLGESTDLKIYDVSGRIVKSIKLLGNGFIQKEIINLSSPNYATGIYLLKTESGDKKFSVRLIKN